MKIELDILLKPEYLHKNIETYILQQAISTYKHTTLKDIGYIIDIHSLEKITDMSIHTYEHDIIIRATYNADIFLPTENKIINGCDVHMIFVHGIFIKYHNIDILIPAKHLHEYTFDENTQSFINKHNKHTISLTSKINIKLTDIRYSENEFSCLADIQ